MYLTAKNRPRAFEFSRVADAHDPVKCGKSQLGDVLAIRVWHFEIGPAFLLNIRHHDVRISAASFIKVARDQAETGAS